jgi:hypothetical protein
MTIKDSIFQGTGNTTVEEAIRISPLNQLSDLTISGNTIDGYRMGIRFYQAAAKVNITEAGLRPYSVDINNNQIFDPANTAISVQVGMKSTGQSYIRNNNVTNCGDSSEDAVNCFQLNHLDAVIIENNKIDGMDTATCDGGGIIIDWAWQDPLYGSTNVVVRDNDLRNANPAACPGRGLIVYRSQDGQFYDNLIVGNDKGVTHAAHASNNGNLFWNNTVAGNTDDGVELKAGSLTSTWVNNIIDGNGAYGVHDETGIDANDPTFTYNDLFNNTSGNYTGFALGTGCIETDPALDSAYRINASSPAWGTGDSTVNVQAHCGAAANMGFFAGCYTMSGVSF